MTLFKKIIKAKFLSRPNRFLVNCIVDGSKISAYLPNPGRLYELFFVNSTLYLEKNEKRDRKTKYTVVAVERDNSPVMLHTHRTNDIVEYLIKKNLVPKLKNISEIRREVKFGKSRFDFSIMKENKRILLEVKSCTLFSKSVAMFPDAVTERGKRHLEELAAISTKKCKNVVLFLVNAPEAKIFLPDYHTDPNFAETFLKIRGKLSIIPLAIKWNKNMEINESCIRQLKIPWNLLKKEFKDSGCYLIILKSPTDKILSIGRLGKICFKKGYYIYVGSAKKNLLKRIQRHHREKKKLFWHIDYIRKEMDFITDFPVRTSQDLECKLSKEIKKISSGEIIGFGSSDCKCSSHLFYSEGNPLAEPKFMKLLLYYRLERLTTML
ncbi:MAG: DNA/RNA nuclease SfsA [Candidatus Schekmanbacteria bacterium]|nr:MAG: DNA/RNA nuclease SfsA [Candidatus Schekmanbacteria bacterium]